VLWNAKRSSPANDAGADSKMAIRMIDRGIRVRFGEMGQAIRLPHTNR